MTCQISEETIKGVIKMRAKFRQGATKNFIRRLLKPISQQEVAENGVRNSIYSDVF